MFGKLEDVKSFVPSGVTRVVLVSNSNLNSGVSFLEARVSARD